MNKKIIESEIIKTNQTLVFMICVLCFIMATTSLYNSNDFGLGLQTGYLSVVIILLIRNLFFINKQKENEKLINKILLKKYVIRNYKNLIICLAAHLLILLLAMIYNDVLLIGIAYGFFLGFLFSFSLTINELDKGLL